MPGLVRTGFVLAMLLAPAARVHAQVEVNQLDLQLRPVGAHPVTATFGVRNSGAAATTVQIHLEDWDRQEDGTNRFLPLGSIWGSCGERLQAFPTTLSLAPGQSQIVRVTFTPDSTAATPAECWSIVFVEQPPPPPRAGGNGLVLQVRTGVKVYVTPPGLERSATVERLELLPGADSNGVRHVRLAVRNDGAVHFEAVTRLEIRLPGDSVVGSVALPTIYALPGALAVETVALPVLRPGRYVLLLFVDYGAPDLLAGQLEIEIPR